MQRTKRLMVLMMETAQSPPTSPPYMPRLKRFTCKDSSFASKVEMLLATTVGGPWTAAIVSLAFTFPLVQ